MSVTIGHYELSRGQEPTIFSIPNRPHPGTFFSDALAFGPGEVGDVLTTEIAGFYRSNGVK